MTQFVDGATSLKSQEREDAVDFPLTDAGNGERVIHEHGDSLKYVGLWNKWISYDGGRWRADNTGAANRKALETVRAMKVRGARLAKSADDQRQAKGMQLLKWAHGCESHKRLRDMLAQAATVAGASVMPDALDSDDDLFNVANGTLDLSTGVLLAHNPADLITKQSPIAYVPGAKAPTWLRFLDRIFAGNEGLIGFIQRGAGYSATGSGRERVAFILHGNGSNGKSTFLGGIREVLGEYSIGIAPDTLMVKKHDGIPNDIARLKGSRFVSTVESDEGRRLSEGLIKTMTGGEDMLTARFMRGEFFDFKPTFKVWLATNHKPEIRGTDSAIWNRIRLVPFGVQIPGDEIDKTLPEKLRAESEGILAWVIDGCRQWRDHGLGAPPEVLEATAEYREENDRLGGFINDECVLGPRCSAGATDLFERYGIWCNLNRETPFSQTRFGRALTERGFGKQKDSNTSCITRLGIGFKSSFG